MNNCKEKLQGKLKGKIPGKICGKNSSEKFQEKLQGKIGGKIVGKIAGKMGKFEKKLQENMGTLKENSCKNCRKIGGNIWKNCRQIVGKNFRKNCSENLLKSPLNIPEIFSSLKNSVKHFRINSTKTSLNTYINDSRAQTNYSTHRSSFAVFTPNQMKHRKTPIHLIEIE